MAGVDSRESLVQRHLLVSARRCGGTHGGALLIGRMAWSLSLRIVNCGWLPPPAIFIYLLDQIVTLYNPLVITSQHPTSPLLDALSSPPPARRALSAHKPSESVQSGITNKNFIQEFARVSPSRSPGMVVARNMTSPL